MTTGSKIFLVSMTAASGKGFPCAGYLRMCQKSVCPHNFAMWRSSQREETIEKAGRWKGNPSFRARDDDTSRNELVCHESPETASWAGDDPVWAVWHKTTLPLHSSSLQSGIKLWFGYFLGQFAIFCIEGFVVADLVGPAPRLSEELNVECRKRSFQTVILQDEHLPGREVMAGSSLPGHTLLLVLLIQDAWI